MKGRFRFKKSDLIVALLCCGFLVACLGAIGAGGKRRVKEAICATNLRQWGHALLALAKDNGGYLMDRADAIYWFVTLEPYYTDRRLLLCPEATLAMYEGGVNPHMAWEIESYSAYTGSYVTYKGSYVINLWIANEADPNKYWRTPYVAGAGSIPMMADGQWKDMQPFPSDVPLPYEVSLWTPAADEMQRACVNRHIGVNVLYLDGSVKKIGLKHLWVQRWYRGWEEDFAQVGLPEWPEWVADFKDP